MAAAVLIALQAISAHETVLDNAAGGVVATERAHERQRSGQTDSPSSQRPSGAAVI